MTDGVLAALITGGISLLGMIVTTMVTASSARRLMEYQIREIKADIAALNERVNRHNNLVERMAVVEAGTRSAHKRLDEMKH